MDVVIVVDVEGGRCQGGGRLPCDPLLANLFTNNGREVTLHLVYPFPKTIQGNSVHSNRFGPSKAASGAVYSLYLQGGAG